MPLVKSSWDIAFLVAATKRDADMVKLLLDHGDSIEGYCVRHVPRPYPTCRRASLLLTKIMTRRV